MKHSLGAEDVEKLSWNVVVIYGSEGRRAPTLAIDSGYWVCSGYWLWRLTLAIDSGYLAVDSGEKR